MPFATFAIMDAGSKHEFVISVTESCSSTFRAPSKRSSYGPSFAIMDAGSKHEFVNSVTESCSSTFRAPVKFSGFSARATVQFSFFSRFLRPGARNDFLPSPGADLAIRRGEAAVLQLRQ